jgi:hypothetical protein
MQLYTHYGTAERGRKPFRTVLTWFVPLRKVPTWSSAWRVGWWDPSVKTRWKRSRRLTKQLTRGQPLELIHRREWRGELWEVHDPA